MTTCGIHPATDRSRHRRAFTLIELLIVIALHVLLIALAIPAFRFISGGRSVEAARNQIGATLGRARAEAIANDREEGVAFFLDARTGRNTMALVVRGSGQGDEDVYDNYKGWSLYDSSGKLTSYKRGQVVVCVVADGDPNQAPPTNAPFDYENKLV